MSENQLATVLIIGLSLDGLIFMDTRLLLTCITMKDDGCEKYAIAEALRFCPTRSAMVANSQCVNGQWKQSEYGGLIVVVDTTGICIGCFHNGQAPQPRKPRSPLPCSPPGPLRLCLWPDHLPSQRRSWSGWRRSRYEGDMIMEWFRLGVMIAVMIIFHTIIISSCIDRLTLHVKFIHEELAKFRTELERRNRQAEEEFRRTRRGA